MESRRSAGTIGLRPGSPIRGPVTVPGSKSIAQRALVLASLASGTTRMTCVPDSADVSAAVRLVTDAGADVTRLAPAALAITGRPPGPARGWIPSSALQCGESGTLARLATAAAAFAGRAGAPIELRVAGTLQNRRSTALFAALRAAGVRLACADGPDGSAWPVTLVPIGPQNHVRLVAPRSSQEASAILCALSAWPDTFELEVEGEIPSRPYLELTIAELERFGARVRTRTHGGGEAFEVRGPLRAPADPIAIEPDASAAAVALAAGCLSGGDVRVDGLTSDSRQGDVRIVEHLRAFGCAAGADERGLFARGDVARASDRDLSREPDLAPVVAALAARAALAGLGASRLTGLATLPGKESSRIDVLAAGLRALGLVAEASAEALTIRSGAHVPRAECELDPHEDHRMAFAFALFGLCVEGVNVRAPECVAKSWPRFWTDLERAGAQVERRNSA